MSLSVFLDTVSWYRIPPLIPLMIGKRVYRGSKSFRKTNIVEIERGFCDNEKPRACKINTTV